MRLIHKRLQNYRMAMTLVDRGIGRPAIQIAIALDIPNSYPFAAVQHHV
jgi:hypothetical protein